MKNIAILHYSCPPVVGGVEEIVRQQASMFRRHFYPVKVFAGRGDVFQKGLPVEINPMLASNHPQIVDVQKNGAADMPRLRQISKQIESYLRSQLNRFDILIAHNVLTMHYNLPLTMALHRLADERFIRILAWNHDSPFFYDTYPPHLKDEQWAILRRRHQHIDYIAISESRAEEFRRLFNTDETLKVIPNGIDPFRFFRLDDTTWQLIDEQDLFSAELIMVQPSRLHPRKNIEKSIEVLKAFKDRGVKAKLLLTGAFDPHEKSTRTYYHRLNKLALSLGIRDELIVVADYTFRSGKKLPVARVIVRDLYLISDLLFLPSLQEGFGIPLLEAGMIKLPIACSDIPPFKNIGGQDVLYFNPQEAAPSIAAKIETFLKNLSPHRMYRRVISGYVWDNIFSRYMKDFIEKE